MSGTTPSRSGLGPALGLALALASCQGSCGGCDGVTPYPDPPPPGGEPSAGAIGLRLEAGAVDFVAEHLADLLAAALPVHEVAGEGRVVFAIPELSLAGDTLVVRDGCIGEPDPDPCSAADQSPVSSVEIPLDDLRVGAVGRWRVGAAGQQRAEIEIVDLPAFVDLAVAVDPGTGTWSACHLIDEDPTAPAVQIESLRFEVRFEVDAGGILRATAEPASVTLAAFDAAALNRLTVEPCDDPAGCDDPACDSGDCAAVCVAGTEPFTATTLGADLLAPSLEAGPAAEIPARVVAALGPLAEQPLDLAVELSADQALPAAWAPTVRTGAPGPELLWAGSAPDLEPLSLSGPSDWRGVTLALAAGTTAGPASCAPFVAIPDLTLDQGPPPFFEGVVEVTDPRTGAVRTEPFHAVAMVSESFARQLGLSLYQLGGLCLRLGPTPLRDATGGTLDPTLATLIAAAPALAGLGPPEAPLFVDLHPTALPAVRFGSGELIGLEDGIPVYDSDLSVDLGELGLSIYVELDDGFFRVATVAADAELGLDLVRTPEAQVELALEHLTIRDPIDLYGEIPGISLRDLGATLIEITVGHAVASLPAVDLDLAPAASAILGGVPLETRINTVRRDGYGERGYQLAYLTLCDAEDLVDPGALPCYLPPTGRGAPRAPRLASAQRGAVVLAVDPTREHQVKVDGGPWSRFYPAGEGELTVARRVLGLPGTHHLAVRSREPGRYASRAGVVTLPVAIE